MLFCSLLSLAAAALTWAPQASATYWMEEMEHQGLVPGNANSSYQIFRNVKDYGAKGDGVTDDTDAIKFAMSDGNRCAPFECAGGTTTPAVLYFPSGTYMISSTITLYFHTSIHGSPLNRPILKASLAYPADDGAGSTGGLGLLDGIPYGANGLAWKGVNSFFRQLRNLEIDISSVLGKAYGIHWPTAQATSLQNIRVTMADKGAGLEHTGIFIEEGSGGFMENVEMVGGDIGMTLGNQQFTVRNLKFRGCKTAVNQIWDWTWTYQGMEVEDCDVGIDIAGENGESPVGSVLLVDSHFKNTGIAVRTPRAGEEMNPPASASLVIDGSTFSNCPVVLMGPEDEVLISGDLGPGEKVYFIQGHVYHPDTNHTITAGTSSPSFFPPRPAPLTISPSDKTYLTYTKPHYSTLSTSSFISARTFGCAGNGLKDDTTCLTRLLTHAARRNKIIYLDAGHYILARTLHIPPGSRIVGEALSSVLIGTGPYFSSITRPKPVIQVGRAGQKGRIEWSDTLIATRGPTPGAIMLEYNLLTPLSASGAGGRGYYSKPSGMWDVHIRVGGFAGSDLQIAECAITPDVVATADNINPACIAGHTSTHLTPSSGGVYSENCWLWTADHDIESHTNAQITIFVGRGLLVESQKGPVWVVGSGSEHHTLYNYQVRDIGSASGRGSHSKRTGGGGARGAAVYMGLLQSETPYYQPNPPATLPFPADVSTGDPDFATSCAGAGLKGPFSEDNPACAMAWGLRVLGDTGEGLVVNGMGLYSFFNNNDNAICKSAEMDWCQSRMIEIVDTSSAGHGRYDRRDSAGKGKGGGKPEDLVVYNLNTLGSVSMVTRYGEDVAESRDHVEGYNSGIAAWVL